MPLCSDVSAEQVAQSPKSNSNGVGLAVNSMRAGLSSATRKNTAVGELMDPTSASNTPLQSPRALLGPGTPHTPLPRSHTAAATATVGPASQFPASSSASHASNSTAAMQTSCGGGGGAGVHVKTQEESVFFGRNFEKQILELSNTPPAQLPLATLSSLVADGDLASPGTPQSPASPSHAASRRTLEQRRELIQQFFKDCNTWYPSRTLCIFMFVLF